MNTTNDHETTNTTMNTTKTNGYYTTAGNGELTGKNAAGAPYRGIRSARNAAHQRGHEVVTVADGITQAVDRGARPARPPAPVRAGALEYKVVRVSETPTSTARIDKPELAAEFWRDVVTKQPWYDEEKEHLVVLMLNTRHDLKGYALVSIGSLNESVAHPREVFRPAIVSSAYAVLIMHNHPSGNPSPSMSDHGLTRRIKEAGEILQIKVLDHVIIGTGTDEKFSFREAGTL